MNGLYGMRNEESISSPWTWLAAVVASFFLLSCPSAKESLLPPGPQNPVRNLALLDIFADRVQHEAMLWAWTSATQPRSGDSPKAFGILPLLLLPDDEVRTLSGRLNGSQQQCLGAIHSLAVRMQSESDPGVMSALAAIVPLRQQIPDLGEMFTDEGDLALRKERWISQASIARRLAPLLRRLALARNRWARQRSQLGYLELMQQHRGYDPAIVQTLEAEVRLSMESQDIALRPPWAFELIDPALATRMGTRFDAPHCLTRAAFVFEYLGLPPNPPALQVQAAKKSAFSSFAFYPIDPPFEQGITVRPGAGIVPHWSAFHEYGHAAMSLLTEPGSCRTFRHPVSPAVSEGCAKITERLFYSEEWLQSQGVPPDEIASLREWERESERMRMRSILADMELERVFYRDPRGDILGASIAIERRTAGVEISGEFPSWALKRHLAFEPLARVDYLLARCAQAAVYRRLRKLPGGLMGAAARQVLRHEVFRGASGMRFEDWFRRAAGAEPNCAAWSQDVAQSQRP
jgi:hypothetical protein